MNQTFACWKEDLVGITGLCGPFVDELLLANVRDHGWNTEQYLSEVLVAGFEESERKTSEVCYLSISFLFLLRQFHQKLAMDRARRNEGLFFHISPVA